MPQPDRLTNTQQCAGFWGVEIGAMVSLKFLREHIDNL